MISRRQIISRSAGPIFAIFTSNESFLGVDDRSGHLFSISQGTLPWQPILCKNGAKGDYIRSGQKDDKSPIKRAWFCWGDPFGVRTAVEFEKNIHCTRWLQSTVSWMMAIHYHTTDGQRSCCIQGLSSIGSIFHHVWHIDNKSIKWSLSIILQICCKNQHFSVCLAICYQPTLVAW